MQSSSQNVITNKPTTQFFYRADALPVAEPTMSKHCLPWKFYQSFFGQRSHHLILEVIRIWEVLNKFLSLCDGGKISIFYWQLQKLSANSYQLFAGRDVSLATNRSTSDPNHDLGARIFSTEFLPFRHSKNCAGSVALPSVSAFTVITRTDYSYETYDW